MNDFNFSNDEFYMYYTQVSCHSSVAATVTVTTFLIQGGGQQRAAAAAPAIRRHSAGPDIDIQATGSQSHDTTASVRTIGSNGTKGTVSRECLLPPGGRTALPFR